MKSENIQDFHNHDIDITTKTFTLIGSVDETMYEKCLKNMLILNQTTGLITIFLTSEGGDVGYARAIYDVVKASSNVVRFICAGDVQSAGTLILMSGDERIMMPSAKLMLHSGYEGIPENHPRNIDAQYKNARDDEDWMLNVYLDRLNEKKRTDKKKLLTKASVKSSITWDTYLNATEALKLGLATEVGFTI